MAVPSEVLEKIQKFAEDSRKREEEHLASEPAQRDLDEHSRQLDHTLHGLQGQVKRQEEALRELRQSRPLDLPRPELDPASRLAQTRRATEAYKALSRAEPELPDTDSSLGGLLALRETSRLVNELQSSVSAIARTLGADRNRLKTEETNLRDGRVIASELKARIAQLRHAQTEKEAPDKPVDQKKLARELVQQLRRRNTETEKDTKQMRHALTTFIDEHLASMLAAEDLGGPVVGDELDVSDMVLESGYTAQGKPRKPKGGGDDEIDSRQRRIDGYLEGDGNRPRNRREAAAAEMHRLIGELLQAANTSSYIDLDRESPASRFLVKAKIAQYHPRNSRRLRLIDVAREISNR